MDRGVGDEIEKLALEGAQRLVSAMATDAWNAVRPRIAKAVKDVPRLEERMDTDNHRMEQTPTAERDRERADRVEAWRTRLSDALADHPELVDLFREALAGASPSSSLTATQLSQQASVTNGGTVVQSGGNSYVDSPTIDNRQYTTKHQNVGIGGVLGLLKRHRVISTVLALVVVGTSLTIGTGGGTSSATLNPPDVITPAPNGQLTQPTQQVETAITPTRPASSLTHTSVSKWQSKDGYTATVTIAQSDLVKATATPGGACNSNPQTDAAVPYSLTVTNTTPGITLRLGISWRIGSTTNDFSDFRITNEIDFSTGPTCEDHRDGFCCSSRSTDLVATGGSMTISGVLIAGNYYPPNKPNGDRETFRNVAMGIEFVTFGEDTSAVQLSIMPGFTAQVPWDPGIASS